MRARDYESRGLSPEHARRKALDRFGDIDGIGEALRDHDERKNRERNRREYVGDLIQDLKLALRRIRRGPGFAAVVIATLALCVGANSAIFSVVNAVLLRPLPYRDPGALVRVYHVYDGRKSVMSPPNLFDVQQQARSFSGLAAFASTSYNVTTADAGDPARFSGATTSASFFDVLGVRLILGRTFVTEENQPGRTTVAVIGHAMWRQRFGARRDVIGTPLDIDGVRDSIVGVMPEGFAVPRKSEMWTPLEYDKQFTTIGRGAWYIDAIGRLAPGVSEARAASEVETIGRRLEAQYPDDNAKLGITIGSLRESIVGDVQRPLMILLGSVAFVLLIA